MKLLLALTLAAAASLAAAPAKRPATAPALNCEIGLLPGKYSEKSIYQVKAEWTDADGKKVRLDSLRGRPVVLTMFFTNCIHSCPFMVNELKAMQKALSAKASDRTKFVLVSIDPERDSAAALKEFRAKHKLSAEHWMLLTGSHEAVRQLAEKLGFSYAPGSKTQFAHSLLVTVFDGKGEVAHQQSGLGVDRRDASKSVERIASAKNAR
ncbi:MAG: SCO family protein [Verrucomicrobiota bacterium]